MTAGRPPASRARPPSSACCDDGGRRRTGHRRAGPIGPPPQRLGLDRAGGFVHHEQPVGRQVAPYAGLARRPAHLQRVDRRRVPQAEVEIERHLGPEPLRELDEIAPCDRARTQHDLGADRVRRRAAGREPHAREASRRRGVLEQLESAQRQQRQIQVAVAIDVDRGRGPSVVVVVEAEDVRRLYEPVVPAVRVVEEAVALVAAERAPEAARLLLDHQLGSGLPLDGLGVGDNLPPEERSEIRRFGIFMAGVAVGDEDLLVAVVVEVVEQRAPRPAAFVDAERYTAITPRAISRPRARTTGCPA